MPGKRSFTALWTILLVGAFVLPAHGAGLPNGWTNKDIGNPDTKGSTVYDDAKGTWTVTGAGQDIWGDTDQFQYAYTQLKGDGHVTARILSQTGGNPNGWGRNGLMIRESEDPGARDVIMALGAKPDMPGGLNPWSSNGQFFSIRRLQSGTSNYTFDRTLGNFPQYNQEARHGAIGTRDLPIWVRVQRRGNLITTYLSPDAKVWSSQIVPEPIGNTPLPDTMLVGLAVSGNSGTSATLVVDNVAVGNEVLLDGPSDVEATPSQTDTEVLVTFTGIPNATGYTIYRQAQGESQYTKAGSATNLTWFIDTGPDGKGLQAGANYRYVVTATVPQKSSNNTVAVETGGSYPARVTPGPIPFAIGSFLSYDIGTAFQGSTTLDDKGVLTIQASGSDIGLQGDGMRFVGAEAGGDITMTAKLLAKPTSANQDGSVKAGLMIRESLDPAARSAAIVATTNDNPDDTHASVLFTWRKQFGTSPDASNDKNDGTDANSTAYPLWLRIVRRNVVSTSSEPNTQIEGWQSGDGTNFTKLGGDDGGVVMDRLPPQFYIGFAVTNHRDGDFATAKFDANSVTFQ
jgi:hypothetical protein